MKQTTSRFANDLLATEHWSSTSRQEEIKMLIAGDIELDPERRTVKKCGRFIHLTPKEFELTQELMINAGRPIRHAQLLNVVWGSVHGRRPEYLRFYMHQIRKKLENDPRNPEYFRTHSHVGYYFAESL
jgi:two-component system KDP operon response regulator KdpE